MPSGTTTVPCPCCSSDASGTNCASLKKCFQQFTIEYDCDSDTFGGGAWTPGAVDCLPIGTSTALQSVPSGDADFPCLLWKWVPANGTAHCCVDATGCTGLTFTAPAVPTNPQAAGCCCCGCGTYDCAANGCGDTRTVTVSGSGAAYPAGCDGTFTVKSCHTNPAGTPCDSTLAGCQWFLLLDSGDIVNDVTLSCDFVVINGRTVQGWVVTTACGKFINQSCCPNPIPGCPPSGGYFNPDIPGITVTVS